MEIALIVLLVALVAIAIILILAEGKGSQFSLFGILVGIGIGAIVFSHVTNLWVGGIPTGRFNNGDIFQVAFASADTTDSQVAILGLRTVVNANLSKAAGGERDLSLRAYRVTKDNSVVPALISGKTKLPAYIQVYKTGDSLSFKIVSMPPH